MGDGGIGYENEVDDGDDDNWVYDVDDNCELYWYCFLFGIGKFRVKKWWNVSFSGFDINCGRRGFKNIWNIVVVECEWLFVWCNMI